MIKASVSACLIHLLLASLVSGQRCPPNTAMGLCQSVPNPCFGDSDCANGELCCPEACSRTCKPRLTRPVAKDMSAPDLLNDPRVYIGKCPDATCYDMFGGEPNECSTSNLCPRGKVCCNDGCKNICQLTPEYAAMIAQEEARAKMQQHMIIQRQQEEMRRRQREMHEQRQRQLATAELARRQAEARAAAEAELAAQQARAKYEASLTAVAQAQSKAAAALHQGMAQQEQLYGLPQQPAASIVSGGFVTNFVSEPPVANTVNNGNSLDQLAQQGQTTPSVLSFNAMKNDLQAGSQLNQINSPANANPYNSEVQQSVKVKDRQSELLSLIRASPSISAIQTPTRRNPIFPEYSRLSTLNQEVITPDRAERYPPQPYQKSPSTYQEQSLASTFQASQSRPFNHVQNYRGGQPLPGYTYQSVGQARSPTGYYEEPRQGAVHPLLMYHAMQTAA